MSIRTTLLCLRSVEDGWGWGARFHARKPVMRMFEQIRREGVETWSGGGEVSGQK